MDAIRSYIDNMFASFPRTEAVLQAKADMLANMEEKYQEFMSQGCSEYESVGKVISEFGNIDELLSELKIPVQATHKTPLPDAQQVSRDEAESYIKSMKRSGLLRAFAVFFILCGVAIFIFMKAPSYDVEWLPFTLNTDVNEAWGIVSLLLMVAIAVGLFIYANMSLEEYKYIKWDFKIKANAQQWLEDSRHKFMRYYPLTLIFGVILCILAPLLIILPSILHDVGGMETTLVSIMLVVIAVAVFQFIYFANIKEAYDRLLQYGDYNREPENKVLAIVSSAVWPLVMIIFLLNGFLADRWGTAWIIFPITGLAMAIFNGVYNAIKGYKD